MKKIILAIISVFLFFKTLPLKESFFEVNASGLQGSLNDFFKNLGSQANMSRPGAYEDQAAGYYTGGGVYLRNRVNNAQLMSVDLPSFKAGCGGIDLFTGGFSYINSRELVSSMKQIAAKMPSYALMLGVQTISPQIYNIVQELNGLANTINQTNINSCEVAATALAGIWPQSDQANRHLCSAMGSSGGAFTDWAQARQGCGSGGKRNEILANKKDSFKDMFVGEYNLSWIAINKNDFLSQSSDLAQFFMALSGTIISRNAGDHFQMSWYPSLADNDTLITALLDGGSTDIYKCDETSKCLSPLKDTLTIRHDNGFGNKVLDILTSIQIKIETDREISASEKDFLNTTKLPVYKMLNVASVYKRGATNPLDVKDYADLISLDIVYQYLSEILDVIEDSTIQLRAKQVSDLEIRQFIKNIRDARSKLITKRTTAIQNLQANLTFIEKTQVIEKYIQGAASQQIGEKR